MRVICARKDLYEGVQTAARAVSARTSLPILGHLLISAEDDRLLISATDLEIGMECVVEANIVEPGSMTVPARVFNEVLSSLPETDVSLTLDEEYNVKIQCAASEFSIKSLPPEEFPMLPQVVEEQRFTINCDVLRDAVKKTAFAVGIDESRAILTGILLQLTENGLKFVSTDTHRLCVMDCETTESSGTINATVPGRALTELSRVVPEGDGIVSVTISSSQIKFTVDDTILVSRLIEGQFPNFEKVIPTEHTKTLIIPTAQFEQSLKRAAIVARDSSFRTTLKTADGKLTLTAESGSVGTAHEEVEIVKEGDDIEMAFSARYLLDLLAVVDTEAVIMELSGEVNQALIRPQGQDDYLYVVMPMQVR
ncbi:MAG: DNA polymerase III subunit beta [Armatimonadota bacterium]|jgi:DNA polymerase-3 subunit beta